MSLPYPDPEKPPLKPPSDLKPPLLTATTQEGTTSDELLLSKHGLPLFPQPIPSDPLDPLTWPTLQKHAILAIVMALYFMFTYITTTTVPSFPELMDHYGATLEQVNWTVAIPALGLSLGPLLWASPADIIGRRPILILGTLMALVATVGAALAPGLGGYMAARFFQGLGVSPASNVGLAVINDVFFEHERGQKLGLWVLAIDMGLLFGPLIGGFVTLAGHRWIQWVTAILLGVILVAEVAFLPETLYPRRLMAAAAREKDGGGEVPRTKAVVRWNVKPLPGMKHPRVWDTLVRFGKTWKFAVVPVAIVVYCFGWYWWVLSVVTLVPVAYAESYPEPNVQGLLYIGLIVGTLISEVFCSGTLSDRIVVRVAKSNNNQKAPEARLWLAYPAILLTAVGLIVWGISIDKGYHFMVGQVAFALFGAGIQMGNTAVCSYVVDAYPMQSMATMTFYAVMLNMSAFVDPFFIVPWVDNVGWTWTFAGHAIITVGLCVPVFAALHKYGPAIRERAGSPDWVNPEFEESVLHGE
ncbi:major facilitator superfamily domain-containing protein [Podospora conica]|nr:major facilitator superfamily domain-containing protein [Schizothecium conicum]